MYDEEEGEAVEESQMAKTTFSGVSNLKIVKSNKIRKNYKNYVQINSYTSSKLIL